MKELVIEDDFVERFRESGASLHALLGGSRFVKSGLHVKNKRGPRHASDSIEVDRHGNFHLWEAKKSDAYDFTAGKALGQMMMYDWRFGHEVDVDDQVAEVYERVGDNHPLPVLRNLVAAYNIERQLFSSWNLLICGVEPSERHMSFYLSCGEYFGASAPPLAVWTMHLEDDRDVLCCRTPKVAADVRVGRSPS